MSKDYWLEQRILRYLQTHQQAGDTLEGIAKWWLTSKLVDESVVRVRRSLDNLRSKGVVRERVLPDGKSLYVLNDEFGLSERTSEIGTVIPFPAAGQMR
jgi:Fe2+ or Zn2+ uptake regulation protein